MFRSNKIIDSLVNLNLVIWCSLCFCSKMQRVINKLSSIDNHESQANFHFKNLSLFLKIQSCSRWDIESFVLFGNKIENSILILVISISSSAEYTSSQIDYQNQKKWNCHDFKTISSIFIKKEPTNFRIIPTRIVGSKY